MPKIKEKISISNAQLKSELIKLFNSQNTFGKAWFEKSLKDFAEFVGR